MTAKAAQRKVSARHRSSPPVPKPPDGADGTEGGSGAATTAIADQRSAVPRKSETIALLETGGMRG